MDSKLAYDRVVPNVSGNCSVRKTKSTWRKVANELHGTEHFSVVNCIGYQMISADKLDDHAM